jgi:peptide methionine sulfoxide reductase msrA/msrB
MQTIYLAGGCFWGIEAYFQKIQGVLDTEVGYTGGNTENPTYRQVCTGRTGHAETLELQFDESIISLQDILLHFERIHEPTSLNKQGHDIGSQYRSAIFYTSENQKQAALEWKDQAKGRYPERIVTKIAPLKEFYPAEDYHQDYLEKNPGGYCYINLALADKPLKK